MFSNYNDFTGKIPHIIGRLTGLTELYLYKNDLTGQIPTEIGRLTDLKVLALAQNAFSGSLPAELGNLESLEILAIQREKDQEKGPGISGNLPSLSELPYITEVYFEHQKLEGEIPSNFLQSAPKHEVVKVDLTGNNLAGALPKAFDEFWKMNILLADNKITSVPEDLCDEENGGWMGGDIRACFDKGDDSNCCHSILCPPGTFNSEQGRVSPTKGCEQCSVTLFWGSTVCAAPDENEDEFHILSQFFNSMDGRYWTTRHNWKNPEADACDWHGVSCNSDGKVTAIELEDNNLSGTPPPTLFKLPELRILNLKSNSIEFSFSGIGEATNLRELNLAGTGLASLDDVGELNSTNIRVLKLPGNYLQGNIPAALFTLTTLEELTLSHNKLSGQLSDDIQNLVNLRKFHLYGNGVSGQIPTVIGNMVSLEELVLAENDFSGFLPTQLNNLGSLAILSIHQNTKSGTGIGGKLPPFADLIKLTVLQLDSNALTGDVPEDLLANTEVGDKYIELGLSDNQLTGPFPVAWADRFDRLDVDLTGNKISDIDTSVCDNSDWMDGQVGDFGCYAILCPKGRYNEYGRMSDEDSRCRHCDSDTLALYFGSKQCEETGSTETTRYVLEQLYHSTNGDNWDDNTGWLSSADYCNDWYGIECNDDLEVESIDLSENNLSGTPSSKIFGLPALNELDLQTNSITFSFEGIENAVNLQTLYLSETGLTTLDGIEKATNLKALHLTSNDIAGPIPQPLFQVTTLEYLYMNYNKFSGRLSSKIGNLKNLKELYLLHNNLEGQIPAAIGSLSQLKVLALTENNFGGTLPKELNDLTKIETLAIQREGSGDSVGTNPGRSDKRGSGIGGPLLSFNKLQNLKEMYLGSNHLTGPIPFDFLDGVVDKSRPVKVDLIGNQLTGGIPPSLIQFDALTFYTAGNQISGIAPGLCSKLDWMSGEVESYECDAILCPPNTFSVFGRQANDNSACTDCPGTAVAPFYGSFECAEDSQLQEEWILKKFYEATDGDNWRINANWLDPDVSMCDWHGITCVSSQILSVQSIHLEKNALSGKPSTDIFKLPNLQELNLAQNDIDFSFDGIGLATNLEYLNLDDTGLTTLNGIENAEKLTLLHVMKNDFDGNFPEEILLLKDLEVVYLSENDFSTSSVLPSGLGALSKLVFLSCYDCGLSGPLPQWLGDLVNLEYLRLDRNSFSGPLPAEMEKLEKIQHIDLTDQTTRGGSGISGDLLDFAGLPNLVALYLGRNNLEGSIPPTFLQDADVDADVRVDLRLNGLSGEIPAELTRFKKLSLYVANNEITSVPGEVCNSTNALSWNDGNIETFGCPGLLCLPGTYNSLGRATNGSPCDDCALGGSAQFYGSTECEINAEKDILRKIYRSLGGPDWIEDDGWSTEDDNVCGYHGVECDSDGSVVMLDLEDNNLSGDVPSDLFDLKSLKSLRLKGNKIGFSFDGIENANKLEILHLSECGLSSIVGVGKAPSLKSLHLTSNQLSGGIPAELYQLSSLENLFMNYNVLTGNLSPLVGEMTALKNLYLFHNKISGPIPTEIGNLQNLEVLALGENQLTGKLPAQLNNLKNIEIISLQREAGTSGPSVGGPLTEKTSTESGKGLTGPLPALDGLPKLREIYIGSNSINGPIPSTFLQGISDKTQTIKADLTLNELTGAIPSKLAEFADLKLYLAGNRIDSIPDDVCQKAMWMDGEVANSCDAILCEPNTYNEYGRQIDDDVTCQPCPFTYVAEFYGSVGCSPGQEGEFNEREILRMFYDATGGPQWANRDNWGEDNQPICDWYGVTCAGGTVSELLLHSNKLSGTVPPVIFQLPSLKLLNVRDNAVDFTFQGIGDAEELTDLYLDSTAITSLKGLGDATSLRALHLEQNDFGGLPIPDEIFELTELRRLYLSGSNFGGVLSEKIGNLENLKQFYCHGNEITGEIPTTIGELQNLELLVLSENNLYGTLPTEMNKLYSLSSLFIDSFSRKTAGISGPLLDFAGLENLREIFLGSNSLTGSIPKTLLDGLSNKENTITIGLNSNHLTGIVPKELGQFKKLNLDIVGNMIEDIDDELCAMTSWMEGGVGDFGCNALLCPAGYFNQHGRQSTVEAPCVKCSGADQSPYLGSLYCESEEKQKEKLILELFYDTCGGDDWKNNEHWKDDDVDICHWYGVACHEGRTVDSVLLGANNVAGTPPKQLFDMVNLKWLWLYSNPIDFKFDGIGNAVKLTSLLLDSTGLTSIAGIGAASSLVDVDVRFNQLRGRLPGNDISKLHSLETFSCADNQLTGHVPSFASNHKLKSVRMSNNLFTGSVPSFETHADMRSLDLSGNRLTGPIPSDLFDSANTAGSIFIDLSSNMLTGLVPSELQRFDTLTIFLRDNMIQGIDPELCNQDEWNDGDVGNFECDGLLCPIGTYAPNTGRASKESGTQCQACDLANHFGSSTCGISAESSGTRVDVPALMCILGAIAAAVAPAIL